MRARSIADCLVLRRLPTDGDELVTLRGTAAFDEVADLRLDRLRRIVRVLPHELQAGLRGRLRKCLFGAVEQALQGPAHGAPPASILPSSGGGNIGDPARRCKRFTRSSSIVDS